jgi:hypothetical protein
LLKKNRKKKRGKENSKSKWNTDRKGSKGPGGKRQLIFVE